MIYCPQCARPSGDAAKFCQACGTSLPVPVSPPVLVEGYAGFWKRFVAFLIDAIIAGGISGIVAIGTAGVGAIGIFFVPWLYEALMTSSEKQATVGKILLGIAVTDLNGNRISFGRATGRHFAKWLSALFLGIGFLMAAFTQKKQALHDMMADTLVVVRPQL